MAEEKEITGVCCICGGPIFGWGNNPDGAVWKNPDGTITLGNFDPKDRCCDECNDCYVIIGRLYRMNLSKTSK